MQKKKNKQFWDRFCDDNDLIKFKIISCVILAIGFLIYDGRF